MSLDRMRLKTRRFVTVRSWSSGLDEAFKTGIIKRFKSLPLDLDPTRQMLPPRLNPGRHNSVLRAHAFDDLWWSSRPRDRSVWCRHVSLNLTVIILFKRQVHDQIWWTLVNEIHACQSSRLLIQRSWCRHVAWKWNTVWDFSPTRKRLINLSGL